jgi:hypothetical protein
MGLIWKYPSVYILGVQNSRGELVKALVQTNVDGTYTVNYTPEDVGHYTITVTYGGQEIPTGPIHVNSVPTGNAEQVKLTGKSLSGKIFINYSFAFF